ncbi:MAG TPA: hypothetical protein VM695_01515 [Phycisphaerae bacterium]|nr:hypothetical protein [Phycisphaerae bacterium]
MSENCEAEREGGAPADIPAPWRGAFGRWLAAAALTGYVAVWCLLGYSAPHSRALLGASFWDLQNTEAFAGWLGGLALAGLVEVLRFAAVGLLAPLTMAPPATKRGSGAKWAAAVLISLSLSALVRAIERRGVPAMAHMVLPAAGCLLGVWVGRAWGRGLRALLWMVPKLAALVLALGVTGAILAHAALEDAPLPFQPPAVTLQGKRRVVNAVRSGIRRRHGEPGPRSLCLAEGDIDFLLAWGLSLGSPRRKAVVRLGEGQLTGQASAGMPFGEGRRYLNLRIVAGIRIDKGRLGLSVKELRIGSLPVPGPVIGLLTRALLAEVERDPQLTEALASVRSLEVRPGAVEVVYGMGALDRRALPFLLERLGAKPDVASEAREYVQYLVSVAPSLPRGEARFGAFLEKAFSLARDRAEQSHPELENRAAIFALAVLLGHPRVEGLVGPVTDPEMRTAAGRAVGRVTLRGRNDWVRHFLVSAAIALASAEVVSDAAGLLKEELDAGGGSGFSFADLLADRAGTLFALAATREGSAAAMQQRLIAGFQVEDFFPPAADLPEGISDTRLRAEYGGVGGAGYREVEREIERRLRTCAALQ